MKKKYLPSFNQFIIFCGIHITTIFAATTVNQDGFSTNSNNSLPVGGYSSAIGLSNMITSGNLQHISATVFGSNFASGYGNNIQLSDHSISMGVSNSLLRQDGSFAVGWYNSISSSTAGSANFLAGYDNSSIGIDNSGNILLGNNNTANGYDSWILGAGHVGMDMTVSLGMFSSNVTNAALIVGTGTSPTLRNNGLVVMKNGQVVVPGSMTVGGSPVVTNAFLTTNNYLTKAYGPNASAASVATLAIGQNALASGERAIAIGNDSKAQDFSTVGIGWDAEANAYGSTAIGMSTTADGADSVVIGRLAKSFPWCDRSVALGYRAWANGSRTTSVGYSTEAKGYESTALGSHTLANGNYSLAVGWATISNSLGTMAIGSHNIGIAGNNSSWIETDSVFELGNGQDGNARSNAITTLKNGQSTLTNKAWKAHVTANSTQALADPPATDTDSGGNALVVEGHTVLKGKVVIEVPQGDISMGIYQ